MTDIVKKITKRTGRAFGVSEIRDDLTSLSNKVDASKQDYLKRQDEFKKSLFELYDNLKNEIGIAREYETFSYYNELAKVIHPRLFEQYRGINKNKSVVLVACGPSLDDYIVDKNMYHVGVNRAFLKDGLRLDALFMHDRMMLDAHKEDLARLETDKFVAFATNRYNSANFNMKTQEVDEINGRRFIISDVGIPKIDGGVFDVINPDICNGVLMDRGGGTVFSALQFALFTEPSNLYLVGCDCNGNGYFSEASHVIQKKLS